MGNVIICETKQAEHPFIFENTKVEVFSYEELCFYIYNNLAILNIEQISSKFVLWLKNELKLEALAKKILELRAANGSLEEILVEILVAKNYYTRNEVKEFITKFERLNLLRDYEKAKLQADGFLMYRRYLRAAAIYDDILKKEDTISDKTFLGNVYHNRGIALANNMELTGAKKSFLKAYELNENEESLKDYFVVLASHAPKNMIKAEVEKFQLPEEYYDDILMELEDSKTDVAGMTIYHRIERAFYNKKHGDIIEFERRMDSVLSQIKDEFREQTI